MELCPRAVMPLPRKILCTCKTIIKIFGVTLPVVIDRPRSTSAPVNIQFVEARACGRPEPIARQRLQLIAFALSR